MRLKGNGATLEPNDNRNAGKHCCFYRVDQPWFCKVRTHKGQNIKRLNKAACF